LYICKSTISNELDLNQETLYQTMLNSASHGKGRVLHMGRFQPLTQILDLAENVWQNFIREEDQSMEM